MSNYKSIFSVLYRFPLCRTIKSDDSLKRLYELLSVCLKEVSRVEIWCETPDGSRYESVRHSMNNTRIYEENKHTQHIHIDFVPFNHNLVLHHWQLIIVPRPQDFIRCSGWMKHIIRYSVMVMSSLDCIVSRVGKSVPWRLHISLRLWFDFYIWRTCLIYSLEVRGKWFRLAQVHNDARCVVCLTSKVFPCPHTVSLYKKIAIQMNGQDIKIGIDCTVISSRSCFRRFIDVLPNLHQWEGHPMCSIGTCCDSIETWRVYHEVR